MIIVKSQEELAAMRVTGRITAQVRDKVAAAVSPGVTTGELADFARELIEESGGKSAFRGYHGFPGEICVSVNDCVVHGIPGARKIEIGDIVSLDIGVEFDGFIGDTATTVMVGVVDPEVINLVNTTRQALEEGIAAAQKNNRVGDISHAVQKTAEAAGYTVVRNFTGHGVGRRLHEDPQVPNYGRPGRGPKLRNGMTLAIEPMVNMGTADVKVLDDGWTVLTADGSLSAHFEHTVAVHDGVAEVLTL